MYGVKRGIRWSKLRKLIRELICTELRNRIDLHVTSYRRSHDEAEKVWITIDGVTVLTASWYQYQWHGWPRDPKGRLDHKAVLDCDFTSIDWSETHRPQEVGEALRAYVDLPIRSALKSRNPFIKAFSIIDRRVGNRTIQRMEISEEDHHLVKLFYALRLDATNSQKSSG